MSMFPQRVCSFQTYSGLMKLDVINKTAYKRLRNGNFQIVVSLLYVHYFICLFLSCKQYSHALHSAFIQEKV